MGGICFFDLAMITPVFEVDQNEDFVIVKMRAPHIKVNTFDFYIQERTFKFYGKPYFLRLVFSSPLVEDGREKASFDVDTGLLTVLLPKQNKGEEFSDLDLLTLLKQKEPANENKTSAISLIQEMEDPQQSFDEIGAPNRDGTEDCTNELDWDLPQELPGAPPSSMLGQHFFGFQDKYSDYFDDLVEEFYEIMELPALPKLLSVEERRQIREIRENARFSIDHYMADFVEDDMIQEILRWNLDWNNLKDYATSKYPDAPNSALSIPSSETQSSTPSIFTDQEKDLLRQLPHREYLLDEHETQTAMLNLLDILLAFTYDLRTTLGEHTVESGWTISRVSAVFSSSDSFRTLGDVIRAFLRRSLSFPLYSHWKLSLQVLRDVADLLKQGKRFILKALLAMKRTLQFSEFHAHFIKLYVDDYCIWIQSASPSLIESLAKKLQDTIPSIHPDLTDWDLTLLEQTAMEIENLSDDEDEGENQEGME